MKIDVIIDTVCPWCFIGKRRLERAFALRPDLKAEIEWRPSLLNPDMPAGGIDRTDYLVKKFGSESRVRRIYGAIADAGESVEIDFAFDRIRRTPNSVDSHRLIRYAERFGKADEMVENLFVAFFVTGRDIGDLRVLADMAETTGFDRQEVETYLNEEDDSALIYDENARAHRLGINGVPAYVFNESWVISGAQEPQVLSRMLDAAFQAGNAA